MDEAPYGRTKRPRAPVADLYRCTARSGRAKRRCRKARCRGMTVCATHGGSTRAAKSKAAERLLEAADPAAARLVKALEDENPAVAIKAAQLVLDRAGLGPGSKLELSGEVETGPPMLDFDKLRPETRRMLLEDLERDAPHPPPAPVMRHVARDQGAPAADLDEDEEEL